MYKVRQDTNSSSQFSELLGEVLQTTEKTKSDNTISSLLYNGTSDVYMPTNPSIQNEAQATPISGGLSPLIMKISLKKQQKNTIYLRN